jgi:hypothetical protein
LRDVHSLILEHRSRSFEQPLLESLVSPRFSDNLTHFLALFFLIHYGPPIVKVVWSYFPCSAPCPNRFKQQAELLKAPQFQTRREQTDLRSHPAQAVSLGMIRPISHSSHS